MLSQQTTLFNDSEFGPIFEEDDDERYRLHLEQSREIVDEAIRRHQPRRTYVLFSGGRDSQALAQLLVDEFSRDIDALAWIDTGVRADQNPEFVKHYRDALGVDLEVYRAKEYKRGDGTPDPQRYRDLVVPPEVRAGELDPQERGGFPGPTSFGHQKMFDRLKGRPIAELVREAKQEWDDRVLLISGVRATESARRAPLARRGPINRDGAKVWCNPMLYWTEELRNRFLPHDLDLNPVYRIAGLSGDCFCGAYTKGVRERNGIDAHCPKLSRQIEQIESLAFRHGYVWPWEGQPPRGWGTDGEGSGDEAADAEQLALDNICSGCAFEYHKTKSDDGKQTDKDVWTERARRRFGWDPDKGEIVE